MAPTRRAADDWRLRADPRVERVERPGQPPDQQHRSHERGAPGQTRR